MSTSDPTAPGGASDAYEPPSVTETLEADASVAELAVGGALRGVEVGAVVLLGLLVCPPLAVLAVVVVVPVVAMALILGLVAAVLTAPYLLVHHLRSRDRRHTSLLAHRVRHAGRALVDLLPHRIVADAGTHHHDDR